MNPTSPDQDLRDLAQAAGISVDWRDAQGRAQTVSHDVLTVFLERLGLPAASASQRAESAARLAQASGEPALAIGAAGQTLRVRGQPGTAVIELDSGAALAVQAEADHDGFVRIVLPDYPGYHRLVMGALQPPGIGAHMHDFEVRFPAPRDLKRHRHHGGARLG